MLDRSKGKASDQRSCEADFLVGLGTRPPCSLVGSNATLPSQFVERLPRDAEHLANAFRTNPVLTTRSCHPPGICRIVGHSEVSQKRHCGKLGQLDRCPPLSVRSPLRMFPSAHAARGDSLGLPPN